MSLRDILKSKWTIRALGAVLFLAYCFYVLNLFLRVPANSDFSNLVLEASDIVSGNLFLSGWNLTGITFYTTDLLYFVVGVLFFGTGYKALFAATTLMFIMLILASLLLLSGDRKLRAADVFLFAAIACFPGAYSCNILRAHTGAAVYVLLAVFFMQKVFSSEAGTFARRNVFFSALALIMLTLGGIGDPITLVIGVLPIALFCLFQLCTNKQPHKVKNIAFLILAALAVLLSKLGDVLLQKLGQFNKNDFMGSRAFGDMDAIEIRFKLYLTSVFNMFGAEFQGKPIGISAAVYFVWALVVLFGFFVVIRNFVLFLKGQSTSCVDPILSLSVLCISAVFILTDIGVDVNSARYFAFFPAVFAVLIVRYVREVLWDKRIWGKKLPIKLPALLLAAFLVVVSFVPLNYQLPRSSQDDLAAFLRDKGLLNGYAGFWNASHCTLATGNEVQVRAVVGNTTTNQVAKFAWFCKDSWYEDSDKNFMVLDTSGWGGLNEQMVINTFGKADEQYSLHEYTIYVYDHAITDAIAK